MSPKILLVLGSGGRVGASVASLFSQKGYSVAIAARSLDDGKVNEAGHLQIKVDLADPQQVKPAFEKVNAKFGSWPSCVVYNAAAAHFVKGDDPLNGLSAADLQQDFAINNTSALLAAQQAVNGWAALSPETTKSFIYTGNFLNVEVMPALLTNGMGKSAAAHLMRIANETYKPKGRPLIVPVLFNIGLPKGSGFYYADERVATGFAAFRDVNGPGHAEHYLELAESKEPLPWWQTFVSGQGYKYFSATL